MMRRKYLIPVILGSVLLVVIMFSGVYKATSKSPFGEQEQIETLAPKETDEIIVRTEHGSESSLEDFENITPNKQIEVDENGQAIVITDEIRKQRQESLKDTETNTILDATIYPDQTEEQGQPTETLSVEEANELQDDIAANINDITYQDALEMEREIAKAQVKELVDKVPEFKEITDEMIDNYTEDELLALTGKIIQYIR